MASFHVKSLFTNVSLEETILTINKEIKLPSNTQRLLELWVKSTYFCFNGEFYEQTNATAWGSLLYFWYLVYFWKKWRRRFYNQLPRNPLHGWGMWTIFFLYGTILKTFFILTNNTHSKIKVTIEKENNLDVMFKKCSNQLIFGIYRKPIYSNLYVRAESHHYLTQLIWYN